MTTFRKLCLSALLLCTAAVGISQEKETLNVLFIGNSYTARHNLAKVVKTIAEEGNPGLDFKPTTVIYGGRTLSDHWNLGTQNVVKLQSLTTEDVNASLVILKKGFENKKLNGYAKGALSRQTKLLGEIGKPHPKWDIVVLQSYRDDIGDAPTKYAQFAPKFADLAKAQGAKVILYVSSPTTQNAEPLTAAPDPLPVKKKAYMTACAIYSAAFDKSPVGLKTDSITDIRFYEKEPKNKQKDRDGNPIKRTFSEKDRADLQRFAWEAYSESKSLR